MPMLYACLSMINCRFHPDNHPEFTKNAELFAPGKTLDARALLGNDGASMVTGLAPFLKSLPETHQDVIRSAVYHGLKSSRTVTLAWAPAYDHEITVYDAKCGITVMIRSRYPADENIKRGD